MGGAIPLEAGNLSARRHGFHVLKSMKTKSISFCIGHAFSMLGCLLPFVLASCQDLPPPEQMTEAQREAYVEHRRWDLEAENRKQVDAEERR